jgi:hypothetical protein
MDGVHIGDSASFSYTRLDIVSEYTDAQIKRLIVSAMIYTHSGGFEEVVVEGKHTPSTGSLQQTRSIFVLVRNGHWLHLKGSNDKLQASIFHAVLVEIAFYDSRRIHRMAPLRARPGSVARILRSTAVLLASLRLKKQAIAATNKGTSHIKTSQMQHILIYTSQCIHRHRSLASAARELSRWLTARDKDAYYAYAEVRIDVGVRQLNEVDEADKEIVRCATCETRVGTHSACDGQG